MNDFTTEKSISRIIQIQADRIRFLEVRVASLEKENFVLKAALTGQTIEAERSYRDNEERFDQLSKLVLATIVHMVKLYNRPVSYDEIIRAFHTRHPNVAKTETITRRVRELVEKHALASPRRGEFVSIPVKT